MIRKEASAIIGAVICLSLLVSCGLVSPGESKKIETQEDANAVERALWWQLTAAAPNYASRTWDNERVSGSASGYAIVNGTFTKTIYSWDKSSYTYDNVTIQCDDFCTDEEYYPHLTGNARIDGTITWDNPDYSGSWSLTGSMTLSGSYGCSVTFDITIEETGSVRWGTITSDGKTWNVSNL